MPRRVSAAMLVLLALIAGPVLAQNPRDGRLTITVADQTGAMIPGATVTMAGQETVTRQAVVAPAQTSPDGVATLQGLPPGRYLVTVEFPGFETTTLTDLRVRAGDNRQSVVLAIQKVEDTVVVGQDAQAAASERGRTFGSALTREQIDALSDDPEDMRRQLQEMVGGGVLRVDSFEGAQLPPKSQIRSIRVSRDAFAAENHTAGGIFIDIVTQPGGGPIRGGVQSRIRDGSMSGRSPFTARKGPERTQDYSLFFGGALIRDRMGFNLSLNGTTAFETPNLNVDLVTGPRSEALQLRVPRENVNVNGSIDYALTKDQVLRLSYNLSRFEQSNLGIGAYDLPERAFSTDSRTHQLRVQEVGPLGRRFFTNTRLFVLWSDSTSLSATEAPTIRVNDAFTAGGQQQQGGRQTRNVNLASDLDYVRGIHSVRMGVVFDSRWERSDAFSNYLGTYTFESLAAFEAGTPRSYTRRLGDPNIDYFNLQGAYYIQDDIRIRPGLTLSPGVRYEVQTHVRDFNNIGPRLGVTWSPSRSGRTTLRASTGVFYDWLGTGTYEQTLRIDGFRQREINIADPSFPDPGTVGTVLPGNWYLLGDGVRMPRNLRVSGGIDQAVTRTIRAGVTYAHVRGTGLQRGRNLNAPVDRIRPDPGFVNIIQVVSDAESRQDTLSVNVDGGLTTPAPPILSGTAALFDWKRFRFFAGYTLGRSRNNTEGDFGVPASGSLAAEWGFAPQDVRHRGNVGVSSQMLRNLSLNVNWNASSGTPYTIRSGDDDNGDLIFNDRPAAVERNSARASGQRSVNATVQYSFTFGRRNTPPPPGIFITAVGGQAPTVQTVAQDNWRYRVSLYVQAQNLTNRSNFVGYNGNQRSDLFGRPTAVLNPRKVDMGIQFNF